MNVELWIRARLKESCSVSQVHFSDPASLFQLPFLLYVNPTFSTVPNVLTPVWMLVFSLFISEMFALWNKLWTAAPKGNSRMHLLCLRDNLFSHPSSPQSPSQNHHFPQWLSLFPHAWVLVQGSEESSCVNSGSKQQSGQQYLHIDIYNYTITFAVGEGW